MKQNRVFEALILDMDGVLIDSQELHYRAGRRMLSKLGISAEEGELHRFTGLSPRNSYMRMSRHYKIDLSFEEFMSLGLKEMLREFRKGAPLMPGARELLGEAKKRGLKRALATSSPGEIAEIVLQQHSLRELFDAVVTGSDVEKGKPHQDTYLLASRRIGVKPLCCLAVEDSDIGIASAKKAGMFCVALRNPTTKGQSLDRADAVVNSLAEVKRFLT